MALQWFPGHMHKALKEIKESLSQVDILIEVLDARIPYSSENPEIAKIRGDKPCIKILNKYDLADPDITARWQEHLEQERGVKTITTSSDNPGNSKQIMQLIRSICSKKDAQPKAIKAMITGIPNVGKSTLINAVLGSKISIVSPKPQTTRHRILGVHTIDGCQIVFVDTPGLHNSAGKAMNRMMNRTATSALMDADVVLFMSEQQFGAAPTRTFCSVCRTSTHRLSPC